MDRPRIKIPLDFSDWIMEIVGAVFLILMIGFPLYYYGELPDTIPRHFNALGEPDGFSQKGTLWVMPIVGVMTYFGMLLLNRFPHVFNYPSEITEENAERQYRMATKLIRSLNLLVVVFFAYIGYGTIQTALNKQSGLGSWFLPVFVLVIFGTLGIYLYQASKNRSTKG